MTTLPELHSSRIRFAAIWLAIVATTMTVHVAKTMKNLLCTILAAGADLPEVPTPLPLDRRSMPRLTSCAQRASRSS